MLTALNALIENQGLGSLTTCLATVKETSVQYPKTMLKIFCSLLRKHQRGIIFTILELSFPSFSSSHPPTHGTCLPKAPCTPIPNSLQTSQLCCCFSHSSLAQRVMKLFRKCFLLPHHTKTVQRTVSRVLSPETHSTATQPTALPASQDDSFSHWWSTFPSLSLLPTAPKSQGLGEAHD